MKVVVLVGNSVGTVDCLPNSVVYNVTCYLVFQEDFAQACITFLRRRCPYLLGVSIEKELPKSVQLPQETVVTMLSCLQSFVG